MLKFNICFKCIDTDWNKNLCHTEKLTNTIQNLDEWQLDETCEADKEKFRKEMQQCVKIHSI